MFSKNVCVLVLWTQVASALEGLRYKVELSKATTSKMWTFIVKNITASQGVSAQRFQHILESLTNHCPDFMVLCAYCNELYMSIFLLLAMLY